MTKKIMGLTMAVSLLAIDVALAQTAGPIEEIVVTARKREERVIDAPLSITAFDSNRIKDQGLGSITDIAASTPNFSFAQAFGRTFERPVIRGQSNILGVPNAGVFIDGIFVSGAIATTDLLNLERVEVVRGPQAALFGRGTFAGAINYVSKKPSDTPEMRLRGTVASHSEYELAGSASGALIPGKLYGLVAGRFYRYEGEISNIGRGGGKVGGEKTTSGLISLRYTPTEQFEAVLRLSAQRDRDGHAAFYLQRSALNNCYPAQNTYYCGKAVVPKTVNLNIDQLPEPGLKRETYRASLAMSYDMGAWTLVSNSATSKEKEQNQRDADGTELNIAGFLQSNTNKITDWQQEFRLESPKDQPLRGLIGVYGYWRTTDGVASTLGAAPTRTTSPPDKVRNYAAFASIDYDFTDKLTGTLEMRAAKDELETSGTAVSGVRSRTYSLTADFTSFTPRAILTYKPEQDLTFYGSVSQGNKPGGFNAGLQTPLMPDAERARLAGFATIKEEKAWNYEVGAKGQFLDNRLVVESSLFWIDWTNQQLTTTERYTSVTGVGTNIALIQNAGKTRVKGGELSLTARPDDRWLVAATLGVADAKFREYLDATQLRLTGNASVAGKRTPRAPAVTATGTLGYTHPLENGQALFGRGDVTYQSTRYAQAENLIETGASTKINLRAGWRNENVEMALFGRNIGNDRTALDVTRLTDPSNFRPAFSVALPRGSQYGITVDLTF